MGRTVSGLIKSSAPRKNNSNNNSDGALPSSTKTTTVMKETRAVGVHIWNGDCGQHGKISNYATVPMGFELVEG